MKIIKYILTLVLTRALLLLLCQAPIPIQAQPWSGNAISFNGTSDLMRIGGTPLAPPWTVECVVKRQDAYNYSASLLGGFNSALKLEQVNFSRKVGFTTYGVFGEVDYTFNYSAPTNTWVHLAFVCDTSTRLYVDGVLRDTNSATILLPLDVLGSDYRISSERLRGTVDEVRIWSIARSQAQIQTNLNKPLITPQTNLVAYWQFDESEGNYANDSSGNGHIGILNSGTNWVPSIIPTATVIGFDDLASITFVTNQYQNVGGANIGVSFTSAGPDYGLIPNTATVPSGEANSGSQVLDITSISGEFPLALVVGDLSTLASSVTLFAGYFDTGNPSATNVNTAHVVLTAYDIFHNLVGQVTNTVQAYNGFHAPLTVNSSSANIFSFKVTTEAVDNGKQMGIDDLTVLTPATPPPADFALALAQTEYVRLFPGGNPVSLQAVVERVNGSTGPINISLSGLPPGVTVTSITPDPLSGTASLVTITFSAAVSALITSPNGVPVTLIATPVTSSAGLTARSVQIHVSVQPDFTVSLPPYTSLFPCSTTPLTVSISSNVTNFQGQIALSVSGLPNGVTASFNPQTVTNIAGGGVATSTLRFNVLGPTASPASITVTGRSGAQSSSAVEQIQVISEHISSFSPLAGAAPQSLQPGSQVTINGTGFAPGSVVEFGNIYGTNTQPAQISSDGTQIKVFVPRLATTGPIAVQSPGGCSYSSSVPFTVSTYRNTYGFPFDNAALSFQASGYGVDDWVAIYGVESLWDIPFPIPNDSAWAMLGLMNKIGEADNGNCTGFSLASQRIQRNDPPVSNFPIEPNVFPKIWEVVGPDINNSYKGSSQIESFIHRLQLCVISDQFLDYCMKEQAAHRAATSSDIYGEIAGYLAAGDHPMITVFNSIADSHSIIAYDLEQVNNSPSEFYIYVYNNNCPFTAKENSDADLHAANEVGKEPVDFQPPSTIHITPDGYFRGPATFQGRPDQLMVIPTGVIPDNPSFGALSAVGRIILPGSAKTTQISDSKGHFMISTNGQINVDSVTAFPLGMRVPCVGGLNPSDFEQYVMEGTNVYLQAITGTSNGVYAAWHLWHDYSAEFDNIVVTTNSSDNIRFDPAGATTFTTSDISKPISVYLVARATNIITRTATINTTTFQNGSDTMLFSPARDKFTYVHQGSPTVLSLGLSGISSNGQAQYFFVQNQAVSSGDSITVVPADWSSLSSSGVIWNIVHTGGSSNQVTLFSTQGKINFNNNVPGSIVAPVYGPEPSSSNLSKTGNSASATPVGTQIYGGTLLSGTNFMAQLYGGPTNTPDDFLQPIAAAVQFAAGGSSGFVISPGTVGVTCAPPGQPATLQLRAWDSRNGAHPSYESAASDPLAARGESQSFMSLPLGGGTNTVANLNGLTSFNVWLPGTNGNAWVNSTGGKWENASDWQMGTPSPAQPGVLIANANSKTVYIDNLTTSNFPASMVTGAMTIGANSGSLNTLSLQSAGTSIPLHIVGGLGLADGGNLIVNNSRIQVDGLTQLGLRGQATLELDSGVAQLGEANIGDGVESQGNLFINAGTFLAKSNILVAANDVSSTGFITLAGGTFIQTSGETIIGSSGSGQLTLATGNFQGNSVQLGDDVGSQGTLSLQGGSMVLSQSLLIGNPDGAGPCSVRVASGTLVVSNTTHNALIILNQGSLILNGGSVQTDWLFADETGATLQFSSGVLTSGNTTIINGAPFIVGDNVGPAQLNLPSGSHEFANGLVISTNASLVMGCANITGPVVNMGRMTVNCSSTITINGAYTNNGALIISNGATVLFLGPVINNSTIAATGNSSIQIYGGLVNNGNIRGTVNGPAIIDVQPQGQVADQWSSPGFSVTAGGSAPLSYQWIHNGTNLPNGTASSYTIADALPAMAGNYQVIVANGFGAVTSSIAALTIAPPPPATTPGTKVLVNGVVVLLDDFEGVTAGSQPAANFGSWSSIGGNAVVTSGEFPGPIQGSQYLQIDNTNGGMLSATLNFPATNTGDVFQFDTMAYVSPLAYGITAPLQFFGFKTTNPGSGAGQAPLSAWIGPDGTIYSDPGFGNGVATLSRVSYGVWQHWEICYIVGSGKWSWLINGYGDSNIGLNFVAGDSGIQSLQLISNDHTGNVPVYLDAMPEPYLLNPRLTNDAFAADIVTVGGKYYQIQYKSELSDSLWNTSATTIVGDGTVKTFSEPLGDASRFYRMLIQ